MTEITHQATLTPAVGFLSASSNVTVENDIPSTRLGNESFTSSSSSSSFQMVLIHKESSIKHLSRPVTPAASSRDVASVTPGETHLACGSKGQEGPPTNDRLSEDSNAKELNSTFSDSSVALVEFTSLLQPDKDSCKEQIICMLNGIDNKDVLLEILHMVEKRMGAAQLMDTKKSRDTNLLPTSGLHNIDTLLGSCNRSEIMAQRRAACRNLSLRSRDSRWISCVGKASRNSSLLCENRSFGTSSQATGCTTSMVTTFVRRKSCADAATLGLLHFQQKNNGFNNADKQTFNRSSTSSSQTTTETCSKETPVLADDEVQRILNVVQKAGRRVAISAPVCDVQQIYKCRDTLASAECSKKVQHLVSFLKKFVIFSELGKKEIDEVAMALVKETHPAGTIIMTQGMEFDRKFYLLSKGSCEILKDNKIIEAIARGANFGGLELMYGQEKCTMTVRCVTPCILYTLDETTYRRAIVSGKLNMRKRFESIVLKVPLLSVLSENERLSVVEALTTKLFKKGQYIFHYGQKTSHVYLILEGEAKVVGRRRGHKKEVNWLYKGNTIGELEFIFGYPTDADVIVASDQVVAAGISRNHFELIAGPISVTLKKLAETNPVYSTYYRRRSKFPLRIKHPLNPEMVHKTTELPKVLVSEKGPVNVDPKGELLIPVRLCNHSPPPNSTAIHGNTGRSGNILLTDSPSDVIVHFPIAPLFSASHIVFMCLREDGTVISWSAGLEKLTNYTSSEIIGQSIYSFLLEKNDQKFVRSSVSKAARYAGDVDKYLKRFANTKPKQCRFVRRDGLTNMVLRLEFLPSLVACDNQGAKVVLAYGEEVHWVSELVQYEPLLLFAEFRNILSNPTFTSEERQRLLAESFENFEGTYRAATLSAERLHIVNLQQMVGKIVMDFGSDCVTHGMMIRQHFHELPTMQVYLDAVLLPKCLRHAVNLCINVIHVKKLSIEVSLTTKNGLEFLVIDFCVDGPGFPPEYADALQKGLPSTYPGRAVHSTPHNTADSKRKVDHHDNRMSTNAYFDEAVLHSTDQGVIKEWENLEWVQAAVVEQGGTMRIVNAPGSSNLLFLIPFLPVQALSKDNTFSNEDSLSNASESDSSKRPNITRTTRHSTRSRGSLASINGFGKPLSRESTSSHTRHATEPDSLLIPNEGMKGMDGKTNDAYAHMECNSNQDVCAQKACCYTTLVVEDNPVHRNMLCAYLWQRKHAVLSAQSIDDIELLSGVVDILFIDLSQPVLRSLGPRDAITLLKGKMTQMAIVLTSEESTLASCEAFHTAGFISLKKPCTPAQAMQVISTAEEKMFVVKQEAERIAHIREELSKGSHVKWKLGCMIGKGAFSKVYEVTDMLTGGKMAMKEIRLDSDKVLTENSFYEIATMCNLQHPNIIHYFYCEESPDKRTIRVFMEYATGGTLRDLLKNRESTLPFSHIQHLLRDITAGLAYIHSQCYVHSDIKTANILLAQDGTGKIGDLGSARQISKGQLLYDMQGSPLYMSPECMSAGEISSETGIRIGYSFPSDIWSLGCVALELATNNPPFSHIEEVKGAAGLTKYITSLSDTPDLSPLFDFPPCLTEFVSMCLNPQPEHRATAQQLLQLSIFAESADESTKSATLALQRAHLLHILNKFVAFQDLPELPSNTASRTLPGERDSTGSKSLSLMRSPLGLIPEEGGNFTGYFSAEKETRWGKDKVHKKALGVVKKHSPLSRSNEVHKKDTMPTHMSSVTPLSPDINISDTTGHGSDRGGAPSKSHTAGALTEKMNKHDKQVGDSELDFFSLASSLAALASSAVSLSHSELRSKDVDATQKPVYIKTALPQFPCTFGDHSSFSSGVSQGTPGEPTYHHLRTPASKLTNSGLMMDEMDSGKRLRKAMDQLRKIHAYHDRGPGALHGAANDALSNILQRKVVVGGASSAESNSSETSSNLRSELHSYTIPHTNQPTVRRKDSPTRAPHNARKVILNRSFFRIETEGRGGEE